MVEPIAKSILGKLPKIGVNTRRLRGDECSEKVLGALKSGVRLVDTAQAYGNEFEVGQAVQNSEVPREDITVITKVQITDYRPYDLLWSVRESLDRLRVDHVDVLVLHGVHPNLGLDRTLDALQEAKSRGLTENIGVADFSASMFREASEKTNGALCCNQIEYHPFIDRDAELAAAKDFSAAIMAYAPLAMGAVNMSPVLVDIAKNIGRSPAQVALRWLLQQDNVIGLPQPVDDLEMRQLMAVDEFKLSAKQMQRISALRSENLSLCATSLDLPTAAA